MKFLVPSLCAVAALSLLAGCADDGRYVVHAGYSGPPIFYDDFYGPYVGGYWGPDNVFIFKDKDGRDRRDDERHFRTVETPGFHAVRPMGGRRH
jgi:hypothetical protein